MTEPEENQHRAIYLGTVFFSLQCYKIAFFQIRRATACNGNDLPGLDRCFYVDKHYQSTVDMQKNGMMDDPVVTA